MSGRQPQTSNVVVDAFVHATTVAFTCGKSKELEALRNVVTMILFAFMLSACAGSPPLYRWGVYEDVLYDAYKNPGETDPITAATRLSEDVARTQAEGLAVPPGVFAHLGYLYYNQGDLAQARAHFERERTLYPESEVFINGVLSRMEKP